MSDSYTFLLEKSRTPIYQRIVKSFRDALLQTGHSVLLIDPAEFNGYQEYLAYIQDNGVDYCLITNPRGLISTYIEANDVFVFELIDTQLIFVHHDNFFSNIYDLKQIRRKLQAFQNIKDRSYHFCLEYLNFLDLRSIGIDRAYPIFHASEFNRDLQIVDNYTYEVSFVGHVLPCLGDELADFPYSHRLRADFWNRIAKLSYRIEPSATTFANEFPFEHKTEIDALAAKYFYISMLHAHSQFARGEIIRRIVTGNVDIIGGDPAYLHNLSHNRKIEKENIKYHSSTTDYSETKNIYSRSKINLNITSLQFDQAVINRVIDIGAVGGFVLTDWKTDLEKITSVAKEISYQTIDELNYKIEYYLHPDHNKERLAIVETLHRDVKKTCTYAAVVDFIRSKLDAVAADQLEPVRIDLGCGPWKADGFIGVDIAPGPGVDVVADLTQRFPFADSSVDLLRAHDVIEHLENRIHTMNEIWRICKPNGTVDIRVPSTDGRGAFQDPTHVSFWNINSFKYYCVEFPNYLKLSHIYGFRGAFSIESLSEEVSEDQVIHVKAKLKAIKQTEADQLVEKFRLREVNFLVCPDWHQSEDMLFQDLVNLFRTLVIHPDRERITLLISTEAIDPESADSAITSVLMYLMTEEGIEISETGPEISLLTDLEPEQWQILLPLLTARLALEVSNQAITLDSIARMPVVELAQLANVAEQ